MTTRKRSSNQALEQAVLGAAMRDEKTFGQLAAIIRRPDVFHSFGHQSIWRAMVKMQGDGIPFDAVGLHQVLIKMKLLDDVGPAYIVELWQNAPATSVDHHAKTLLELFLKREAAEWLKQLGDSLDDASAAPVPLLERAKADLDRLTALAFTGGKDAAEGGGGGYVPFPIQLLPTSLQDFVLAASEALYCDPAFIAVPALVTVGAAIGNSRTVAVKESWQEPSVFWAAIVADSSSLKSPSMDIAVAPLWALQRGMSLEYEEALRYWTKAKSEWTDERYRKRKGDDANFPIGREPEKPNPAKLLVNDITIERLAQVLWQNPQGVCLCRDELAGWFASFGRYSDGKGPGADLPVWLEIFRAKPILIDRKTGDPPSLYIPRAACSVVGTIQPGILQRTLSDDFFDSGLASRLLLCMPPRKAKVWTDEIVSQSIYDTYNNIIRDIYLGGKECMEATKGGSKQIGFTAAGKSAWIEFYSEWADRQTHSEGEQAYALAKLEAYCARFALLLCMYDKAEWPGKKEQVTEGHVKRAFGLVKWFAGEAERVYSMVRNPADKQAKERLVGFIKAIGGRVTARRLMRSNPSRYRTADDATRVLEGLAEKSLGKWITISSEETGGKPTRALEISPDNLTT